MSFAQLKFHLQLYPNSYGEVSKYAIDCHSARCISSHFSFELMRICRLHFKQESIYDAHCNLFVKD